MIDEKLLSFAGLARRAGKLVCGEESSLAMVRKGDAGIILLDSATGVNTTKRFTDASASKNVPIATTTQGALGKAIGKPNAKVAVVSKGAMCDKILLMMNSGTKE